MSKPSSKCPGSPRPPESQFGDTTPPLTFAEGAESLLRTALVSLIENGSGARDRRALDYATEYVAHATGTRGARSQLPRFSIHEQPSCALADSVLVSRQLPRRPQVAGGAASICKLENCFQQVCIATKEVEDYYLNYISVRFPEKMRYGPVTSVSPSLRLPVRKLAPF